MLVFTNWSADHQLLQINEKMTYAQLWDITPLNLSKIEPPWSSLDKGRMAGGRSETPAHTELASLVPRTAHTTDVSGAGTTHTGRTRSGCAPV